MPTVSTLLQRKKYSADPSPAATFNPESNPITQTKERSLSSVRAAAAGKLPPPFKHRVQVESLNLDTLSKSLRRHRKSVNLKKLDLLGYFSTLFAEICYFEFSAAPAPALSCVLGFGNPQLSTMARGIQLSAPQAPNLLKATQAGQIILSAGVTFGAEVNHLQNIGFKQTGGLGIFPVCKSKKLFDLIPISKNKTPAGVWICADAGAKQLNDADRARLAKILLNLQI